MNTFLLIDVLEILLSWPVLTFAFLLICLRHFRRNIAGILDRFHKASARAGGMEFSAETRLDMTETARSSQTATAPEIVEVIIMDFLSRTSHAGLRALYACILAKRSGRSFNFARIPTLNTAYSLGFLIACSSLGLITYTRDNTDWAKWTITDVNIHVQNHTQRCMELTQQQLMESDPDRFNPDTFRGQKAELEAYFANN